MPKISKKEFEELKRLRLIEQSVVAGLRETGFSDKALEFFRYSRIFEGRSQRLTPTYV